MPCQTCSVFINEKLRVQFIKAAWDDYRRAEKRARVSVTQESCWNGFDFQLYNDDDYRI